MRSLPMLSLLWLSVLAGCQDSNDPPKHITSAVDSAGRVDSTSSSDGADAKAEAIVRDPNKNCVPPGTKNNEKGVGGYCEKPEDCKREGGIFVCSAQFGAPDDSWFCTTPCTLDTECGTGAVCVLDVAGSGCAPIACAPTPADSGADASDATDSAAAADSSPG